jgi:type VI secretion system secreted protein VgrG
MAHDDQDDRRPVRSRVIPSLPDIMNIGGGSGQDVPAWKRPDLLICGPGGVTLQTPGHTILSAGATLCLVAHHDINLTSVRHIAVAVSNGLSLFTYGKATHPEKPNPETGLQFHAASGSVSVQAQKNTLELSADGAVNLASTTAAVTVTAPKQVLLAAGGSSLRITSQGITLITPGPAEFKGAMKELAGGADASVPGIEFAEAALHMSKASLEVTLIDADGVMPAAEPVTLVDCGGEAHQLTIAGAPSTLNDFKPGLVRGLQTKRRD